jgi:hypothetical protein
MPVFYIEDDLHDEDWGEFETCEAALQELKVRARLPWDAEPNQAPCTNWRNCGRDYEIVEYDDSEKPWKKLSVVPVLEISSEGVKWKIDPEDFQPPGE